MFPVTIVESGGLAVTNMGGTGGTPMTPVEDGGHPVTLVVSGGYPVSLVNEDLTEWEEPE
jgi:hypothetical protein